MNTARISSLALLLLAAGPARAIDFNLDLTPGLSIPLTAPQSKVYGVGGGESLKALFALTPYLDVGPSVSFLFLPASTGTVKSGIAWGLGAGLRLKRPHDAVSFNGISPWLDVNALYIRTARLNRPGFDAAAGLAFPIGESRIFWIGPFARYLHIQQPQREGYDNRDAKLLTFGISVEFASILGSNRE